MDDTNLEKIEAFIQEHHVLTLATVIENKVSACSLFYVYDTTDMSFIVASAIETEHIQNVLKNSQIAGNILLETKEVGKIQGLQFKGDMFALKKTKLQTLYFKKFPYALALRPKLWKIKINFFKLTDNRLGFGKKIIWSASLM